MLSLHSARVRYGSSTICLLAFLASVVLSSGCSLGPRSLTHSRLRYNDAVKSTSEQQLLLNIVRLRYVDTPSSLAISSIADQQEVVAGLGIVPFFTSAGAGDVGSYRNSILPQAQLSGASRPTLSYTPLDDEEFTRRLFSPISLEGAAYLSKTTWPISTVFRLYLENLNWVSNAETASGPTPATPPDYAVFLEGVQALQRLQDRKLITLFTEEREEAVSTTFPLNESSIADSIDSIKNDLELKSSKEGVSLNAHDGSTPADMIEALFHISEVSNDQGMEALLLVASKTGIELPEGDLTPADLALLIWLNDPDQLRRANCERIVLRFQSFYCFMNRTLEAPLFEMPADGVLKRIEERTNQFNRNRQRGGGAAVWMYEFGNEVAFLIRFGGSLKRDEIMDNDQCRPDIRRPVCYDLVDLFSAQYVSQLPSQVQEPLSRQPATA